VGKLQRAQMVWEQVVRKKASAGSREAGSKG
jgi:hypothetical protein